jgi:hypothetical protein
MGDETAPKRSYFTLAHVAAVLTAIVVYFAIFSVTGDSDLFFPLMSGMGVWVVGWSAAALHWHWN